jgi:hypothetical protein
MRTRFLHRKKSWYWRKTGFGIVQQPYAPNNRQHYKGQPRNTRNFKNSKRKRFMLKIVKLVGMTRKFNELVTQYKQMRHNEAAAHARAYHEIGQILRWQPDAIDAAMDVTDWLPEPIE